jgi:hypothetical protein
VKNMPAIATGPLGPWYKRVNAAVAEVSEGDTRAAVVAKLGEPDEIRIQQQGPAAQLQEMMEGLAGGATLIRYGQVEPFEETLVYVDPYRPRIRYAFAIAAGVVASLWQERVSRDAAEASSPLP